MKITVFGATGHVGKHVVNQGLELGYQIVAFGRNIDKLIDRDIAADALKTVKGYVFEPADVLQALQGADAVISVLGGSFDGMDKTRSLGIKNIIAQMKTAGTKRIVALGNLSVLNAPGNGLLIDQPDFPEEYKPVGYEHVQAWKYLQESGLDWTFVCAPDIKIDQPPAPYITSKDYPPVPNKGHISAASLAAFMLSEVQNNQFLQSRVGISDK